MTQARRYEPFTTQLLREAGIEPGMRVLDVGSGSGNVSFLLARLVGPSGQVVGIDRSAVAVATANRRAGGLQLSNTRFVVGDAGALECEELFDAAVGRLVLEFSRDPAALLRSIAAHVCRGGVIAFQEVDWSGDRSRPPVPTFNRCLSWGVEALQRSGADPYVGLKLFAIFTAAGLPPPALCVQASIGAGPLHPVTRRLPPDAHLAAHHGGAGDSHRRRGRSGHLGKPASAMRRSPQVPHSSGCR